LIEFCPYTGPAEIRTPDNTKVRKNRAPAGIRIEFLFILSGTKGLYLSKVLTLL
jgi:hypothetical protein